MAASGTHHTGLALTKPHGSALGPLREPVFRALWIAAVVSYTGTWMQNLAAGWLMASLTTSPIMVGLVQAAMALPVFLVSIYAGALADIVDRRRLLLATQTWMVLAALALGLLTHFGLTTPLLLLALTFAMGLGNATNDPAWQAITHEIVSEENFPAAIALNSAGFNVARAVGPAIGGLIIAAWGAASAFLLNAASFIGVMAVLFGWKRRPHSAPAPAATMTAAIKIGFRFARDSKPLQAVLIRTAVFSFSAAALWAMLPLVAQCYGSVGFGEMVASFGAGALLGAAVLPTLRQIISTNTLVAAATVLYATASAAVGYIHEFNSHCVLMLISGGAWIVIIASLNVCAQTCSPSWLRARTLSMYLIVFQGGLALGSSTWGAIADSTSIPVALAIASIALIVGLLVSRRFQLHSSPTPIAATPVES